MTRYHCERAGSGHCRHCRRTVPDAFGPIDCPARLRAALDAAMTAAEMAAHLRERDDLREVLRLVRVAWWRTDQEIVPMGGHEGYACARIGPDHAGYWWSRVWIEAWEATGQQITNRHATEEEARAFVLATMQADGWVVLP